MKPDEAKANYMSAKLMKAYEEWIAAGKPRRIDDDEKQKSGAA